jgi:hypothetical protein
MDTPAQSVDGVQEVGGTILEEFEKILRQQDLEEDPMVISTITVVQ